MYLVANNMEKFEEQSQNAIRHTFNYDCNPKYVTKSYYVSVKVIHTYVYK